MFIGRKCRAKIATHWLIPLVHKQHLAELRRKLDSLHPADIAYILEALPIEQRLLVWDLVKAERDGEILIEVSDAVRESLIATMNREELRAAAEQLDTDEIADLAPDLPQNVLRDVFKSLSIEEREQLRAAMSYSEDPVGALMDFSMIQIRRTSPWKWYHVTCAASTSCPITPIRCSWSIGMTASKAFCRSTSSLSTNLK